MKITLRENWPVIAFAAAIIVWIVAIIVIGTDKM